jgi:hypothetical protein
MKTTILLITFGLALATTFAQQSTVNATGSGSSSLSVKTDKTNGKVGVTGTAGAKANSDVAGKTAEGTVKAVDKTKAAVEAEVKKAGNEAKSTVNTNASASIQATSSVKGSENAGDKDNNALSVKSNNNVMLKKEIKGADAVKAIEKVENTAVTGVEKTSSKIKAGSARVKSADETSGKTVSTVSTVKTRLQTKPVKAAVHTKTITGVKIR